MNLRFTLNGIWRVNDMPDGWRDLELTIKRDSTSVAIYQSFTSDFTFWGDGWNYLKYLIDGEGVCARIPCVIEIDRRDTGDWKTLYSGVLDLKDFDINYEKCTATGPIKSGSYLSFISERYDYDVWYFNRFIETGQQMTFGGNPVASQNIARYAHTHDIVTGTQPPGPGVNSVCYRVNDVLTYHLEYMTDNNVTAVSDFFSQQNFQKGITTIDFHADFSPGDQVEIFFVNCYGAGISKTVTISAGTQTGALDEIAQAFLQAGDFTPFIGTGGGPIPASEQAKAAYAIYDGSMFSFADISYVAASVWRVNLEFLTPITNLSVTRVSGACDVNLDTPLVYGMKNLFMAFNTELAGDLLGGAIGDKMLSYKQLFGMLDARFDLGMQLVNIGPDTFQMRIEPKSYFFNFPQIVDAGSALNVTAEANDELLFQNLAIGTKGANANYYKGPSGKSQNWSVGGCSADVKDKVTDANYDIASIGYQPINFASNYQIRYPDDITFFLSTGATVNEGTDPLNPVLSEIFQLRVLNSVVLPSGVTEATLYSFNAGLINFWAVYNHLFSMTGSPQTASRNEEISDAYVVKNEDVAFSRKNYDFDTILKDSQVAMCMLQPTGKVGFRDSHGNQRSDSLFELTWNVNTCKAHFKVFG